MKNIVKIGLTALTIILIILGSILISMENLKKEAENNLQEIAKLHASIFTDQVSQLFTNINVIVDNLGTQVNLNKDIKNSIKSILSNNSYIRSINIIDQNQTVIISSNSININKTINVEDYYPTPMFDNAILRFGKAKKGRDLFTDDNNLSYIPIVKKITNNTNGYQVLITINSDYFTNRYLEHLTLHKEHLEFYRVDGVRLYTTVAQENIGNTIKPSKLYNTALEKSLSWGIEFISGKKSISAYRLTDIYPLALALRLDYDENLKQWNYKTAIALLTIGIIVFSIAFVIIKLLVRYQKSKNREIRYQKQQLIHQEKIRNAYIVYENTNDGILIADQDARIIDVNKAFTVNTGYTLEEIYGLNPNILKSGMHDENFYKAMWNSIEINNYWHGEIINRHKNGHLFTELLTINRILNKENQVKNYIAVFTNITKQKEQEEKLKEQENFIFHQSKMAALGEMLENIAHQWRQPLSVISTAATGGLLERKLGIKDDQKEEERLTLINDSAQHLSKTIDDFRDFFRPDKEKSCFFITDAINQSLKLLESKFKNRDIEVIQNIENIQIEGFENEFVQVIMNILNNARDVLENKEDHERFVFINIFKEDHIAVITLKDNGGGIPTHIIDKVFEPYFTTKHKSQGTGIGLYMSEEIIVKHMNGSITVHNQEYEYNGKIQKGAEFIIKIPIDF